MLTIPRSKHGEARHVPLNSVALMALGQLRMQAGKNDWVIPRGSGADRKAAENIRHSFERACREAGVTAFTWHCLRHTFASRLVMAGVDIRTVQQLLGHKRIATTERYSHLSPEHELAAVERLAGPNSMDQQPPEQPPADPGENKAGGGPNVSFLN